MITKQEIFNKLDSVLITEPLSFFEKLDALYFEYGSHDCKTDNEYKEYLQKVEILRNEIKKKYQKVAREILTRVFNQNYITSWKNIKNNEPLRKDNIITINKFRIGCDILDIKKFKAGDRFIEVRYL